MPKPQIAVGTERGKKQLNSIFGDGIFCTLLQPWAKLWEDRVNQSFLYISLAPDNHQELSHDTQGEVWNLSIS